MSNENLTKRCSICKNTKNVNEFNRDKSRADGFNHRCKPCFYKTQIVYKQTPSGKKVHSRAKKKYRDSVHGKEKEREYKNTAHYKTMSRSYSKKWQKSEKGRESIRLYARYRRKLESEKIKNIARDRVKYAVRKKVIPKVNTLPCDKCNKNANHYHHVNGYDQENWLNVIPLCRQCHIQAHVLTK